MRANGHLSFIAPNKFFKAGYGKNLRMMMSEQVRLIKLFDFGEVPVFDAGTDPSIVLFEKASPANEFEFGVIKKKEELQDLITSINKVRRVLQMADLSNEGWNFGSNEDNALLVKIASNKVSLGAFVSGHFYRGILTAFNDAFVIDRATRDKLISDNPKCKDIIKPWLNGKDILRWRADWKDIFVVHIPSSNNKTWPWSNLSDESAFQCFKKEYPSIEAFFDKVDKETKKEGGKGIREREDQGKFFWELRSCAYDGEFPKKKIVFNETSKKLNAFLDTDGFYINKTGFIILLDESEYLLGIMNSTLMDFYFRSTFPAWGDPWNGGRVQFRGDRMEKLPIAQGESATRKKIAGLVSKISALKKDNPDADVTSLEVEIDREVYKLYNLDAAEIDIIESATKDAQKKAA